MESVKTTTFALERFLAVIAAAISLTVSIRIGQVVGGQQPVWPLPGLYLVEMVALSVIAMIGLARDTVSGGAVSWVVVGVLGAFVVMGAWSVGLVFLPVALIFASTAILSTRRHRRNMRLRIGLGIAAGAAQIVLMFAAIRLLNPGAIF